MLVIVGLLCGSIILLGEYVLGDQFDVTTNENLVSFADEYLEPALKLNFAFEPSGGFGTVHVKALKYVKRHNGTASANHPTLDVDFEIRVFGWRRWLSKNPVDDQKLIRNELLPQIEHEIDERLGGDSGVTTMQASIVDAIVAGCKK